MSQLKIWSVERRNVNTSPQFFGRIQVVAAVLRRVRPCLMTSVTTILALLPVLTSTGRGADIMIPMAIPSVGGMSLALLTMFTVPVLYCAVEESKLRRATAGQDRRATEALSHGD